MKVRNIIPSSVRLYKKLFTRIIFDILSGNYKRFSRNGVLNKNQNFVIQLSQDIKENSLSENKIKNIKLALEKIEKIIIKPNQIFSFWEIVGNPNCKNGFYEGRTIINGKLQKDFGGGLCQLSGIIYHLCLLSKLKVIERYNHSLDIYTDNSRYSPLGADSTVVYGYKDLRFINVYDFPITLNFKLDKNCLTAFLKSSEYIEEQIIHFTKKEINSNIKVLTLNYKGDILAHSSYEKPDNDDTVNNVKINTSFSSILTSFLPAIFILSAICYFLFMGLFEFIIHSFAQSIGSFFISLGLIILLLFFIAGSIMNIKDGIKNIKLRSNSNEVEKTDISILYKSLLLGLVPFIFAVSFGMIDFYLFKIDEIMLLPMLAIIFSPFIFSKRLNVSILEIFYGILFWGILVVVGIYFFK